ncbi:MAG: F0F1 ATP synthase subunit B' [Beijerinckiaceae bacterium]|nr:MAG: F0F1 ATP synthase subunit B' [Beijerinckiaceae bacterium]
MANTTNTAPVTAEHSEMPAAQAPFPPFAPVNLAPLLVWLAISFALLYLLMSRIALPHVEKVLRGRRSKITDDLGDAFARRKEADEASAAYQKTLTDARSNAQALAQQTYTRLAAETDAKRKALDAELSAKLADSEAQIEAMTAKAMANVGQIAHETASAIVEHLTGKPADAKVISEALASVKS